MKLDTWRGFPNSRNSFFYFFKDENGTITASKEVKDLIRKYIKEDFFRYKYSGYSSYKMYKDMIVVHLRFLSPSIRYMDVKYTLMDYLANFGGQFGIFAEVTGCSLLAIINIVILMIKNLMPKG